MDIDFLTNAYFSEVGQRVYGSLENRNRFIEWAHGIISIILFGALVSQSLNPTLAWLASAFVAVIIMPFFSIAVVQHGYFVRFGVIRTAVVEYMSAESATEKESRLSYLKQLISVYDVKAKNSLTRKRLMKDVLLLGFLYLIVAADSAFVWLSYSVLAPLIPKSLNLGNIAVLLVYPLHLDMHALAFVVVIAIVVLAILREVEFLRTTRLLDSDAVPQYTVWLERHSLTK